MLKSRIVNRFAWMIASVAGVGALEMARLPNEGLVEIGASSVRVSWPESAVGLPDLLRPLAPIVGAAQMGSGLGQVLISGVGREEIPVESVRSWLERLLFANGLFMVSVDAELVQVIRLSDDRARSVVSMSARPESLTSLLGEEPRYYPVSVKIPIGDIPALEAVNMALTRLSVPEVETVRLVDRNSAVLLIGLARSAVLIADAFSLSSGGDVDDPLITRVGGLEVRADSIERRLTDLERR